MLSCAKLVRMLSKRHRNIIVAMGSAAMVIHAPVLCGASRTPTSLAAVPVTLHADNIFFPEAVRRFCAQARCTISFQDGFVARELKAMNPGRTVSPHYHRVPLQQVIAGLLRRTDLDWTISFRCVPDASRRTSGALVFVHATGRVTEPVTSCFDGTPLKSALRTVCNQADANYAFSLGAFASRKVTVAFNRTRLDDCVEELIASAHASRDLSVEFYNRSVIVQPRGELHDKAPSRNPLSDVIDVQCDSQNAYAVACCIACAGGGANFVLSEDFKFHKAALSLRHVTVMQALLAFGRRIHTTLNISYDRGVLIIIPKHPRPPIGCPPGARVSADRLPAEVRQ